MSRVRAVKVGVTLAILALGGAVVFFPFPRPAAGGIPHLGPWAAMSRRLRREGFVLANHSYSHAQLAKKTGAALRAEIVQTDTLLKAVDADRSALEDGG